MFADYDGKVAKYKVCNYLQHNYIKMATRITEVIEAKSSS
jgi:hypothetical protein